MRWAQPEMFMWLIMLPALFVAMWWVGRHRTKILSKVLSTRLSGFLTQSVSPGKRKLKSLFLILGLFFIILSMARPQMGSKKQKIKSEGLEIILAIDVSESMLAEDLRPSRLELAKRELSRLVDLIPGYKIGVVGFAGSAALLSPLTNDPSAVKMYLESLDTNAVSSQGTNFESALGSASDAFNRGGVTTDSTTKVSRVILIASDGEDHEPGAIKKAEELSKQGMRIFTVAFGTERGGAIPVRDQMGNLKGYKKDQKGETILTVVKGDALKKLAEIGKGSFYFAQLGGNYLKNIVEDFGQLQKAEYDSEMSVQYNEVYQTFLVIGLFFLCLELLISEIKNPFRIWRGRFS
ncbi:MAG: VWA domain-containing protein [Bdellovibrionota bacterium]